MNNKGQVLFYSFMVGLVIIVLALSLAFPVRESVDTARTSSDLNCSDTTISDVNKATCVVADLTIFHFIGGLIFIGGAVIGAKLIIQ